MEIKTQMPTVAALLELYTNAGWSAYTTHPEKLYRAVAQSLFVATAWEGSRLLGLVRAVGDGESILYIQDLLVRRDYQRRGIGRNLLHAALAAYPNVRQKVLLTDHTAASQAFYRACGFAPAGELGCMAFIQDTRST